MTFNIERLEIERDEEWDKWKIMIPYIQFDSQWLVKVIPPFSGAIVRFLVKIGDHQVSVYLDCYSRLGSPERPYWEIYPYRNDVGRCDIDDADCLMRMIRESFAESNPGDNRAALRRSGASSCSTAGDVCD